MGTFRYTVKRLSLGMAFMMFFFLIFHYVEEPSGSVAEDGKEQKQVCFDVGNTTGTTQDNFISDRDSGKSDSLVRSLLFWDEGQVFTDNLNLKQDKVVKESECMVLHKSFYLKIDTDDGAPPLWL